MKDGKKFIKHTWIWFASAIVVSIGGSILHLILYPTTPTSLTWENILMFLAMSAGIGWIFHGTGFLLVRVR